METGAILEQAIEKDSPHFLSSREDVGHPTRSAGDEEGTGQDAGVWVLRQREAGATSGLRMSGAQNKQCSSAVSLLSEKRSNWVSSPGELKLRAIAVWARTGRGSVARRRRPPRRRGCRRYRLTATPAGVNGNLTQESHHLARFRCRGPGSGWGAAHRLQLPPKGMQPY